MLALPIGEWQTEYIEDTEPITGRMVYVPSCEHHVEEGGHSTYITPKYTSWLAYSILLRVLHKRRSYKYVYRAEVIEICQL